MTGNAKEQSNHSHQPMHIVYASNDGYAVPLGVSLYSLYEHNMDLPLAVHIFSDGISALNLEKFQRTAAAFNREVDIRAMPDLNNLASGNTHGVSLFYGQLSLSAYLRIFLIQLMPPDIDRVLYMDCDTLVNGSVADLFNMDMTSMAGAMCLNVGARNKRLHGFGKGESYYNDGVFMLNLDYWRAHGVYDAVLGEMKRRRGKAIDHDQDYLNCVLRGKVLTIDPRYNFMTHYYWMTLDYDGMLSHAGLDASEMYTHDVLKAALQDVRIYHIIDGTYGGKPRTVRPWVEGYHHPFADVWRREAAKTLWRDAVPPLQDETAPAIAAACTPSSLLTALRRIKRTVLELFMYRIPLTRKIYVRVKYGFWHK